MYLPVARSDTYNGGPAFWFRFNLACPNCDRNAMTNFKDSGSDPADIERCCGANREEG